MSDYTLNYTFIAVAIVTIMIVVPLVVAILATRKGSISGVLVAYSCMLTGFVVSMSSPDYLPYLINSSEIDENSAAPEILLAVACFMLVLGVVVGAIDWRTSRRPK